MSASAGKTPVGERDERRDLHALAWDLTVHRMDRDFARSAFRELAQASDAAHSGTLAQVRMAATRHAIDDIRAALRRIESGTYGTCQQCGCVIAADHMRARPTARWCTVCQT